MFSWVYIALVNYEYSKIPEWMCSRFINLTFGHAISKYSSLIFIILFIRLMGVWGALIFINFTYKSEHSTETSVHFPRTVLLFTHLHCTNIKVDMNRLISIWCVYAYFWHYTSSAISIHFEHCNFFYKWHEYFMARFVAAAVYWCVCFFGFAHT